MGVVKQELVQNKKLRFLGGKEDNFRLGGGQRPGKMLTQWVVHFLCLTYSLLINSFTCISLLLLI